MNQSEPPIEKQIIDEKIGTGNITGATGQQLDRGMR